MKSGVKFFLENAGAACLINARLLFYFKGIARLLGMHLFYNHSTYHSYPQQWKTSEVTVVAPFSSRDEKP
jgi:hypothetical protein